jgi:hypothetical protein
MEQALAEHIAAHPEDAGRTVDDFDWILRVIVRRDEAEAMEQALAEHIAAHPEDAGRTVDDFDWILRVIVRSFVGHGVSEDSQ